MAVDPQNKIIVANNLCNQSNDQNQLKVVAPQIKRNLECNQDELSANARYFSESSVNYLLNNEKIAPYIPHTAAVTLTAYIRYIAFSK